MAFLMNHITWHVVDPQEISDTIAKSFERPAEVADVIREIGANQTEAVFLKRLLPNLRALVEEDVFCSTIGFSTAIVAGFLHPYCYSTHATVDLLSHREADLTSLFTPITKVVKGPLAKLAGANRLLTRRDMQAEAAASGLVLPTALPQFLELIDAVKANPEAEKSADMWSEFREGELADLRGVIQYALEKQLCFLEAVNLVDPPQKRYYTRAQNLRGRFIQQPFPGSN